MPKAVHNLSPAAVLGTSWKPLYDSAGQERPGSPPQYHPIGEEMLGRAMFPKWDRKRTRVQRQVLTLVARAWAEMATFYIRPSGVYMEEQE